jgi:hypothetical protein
VIFVVFVALAAAVAVVVAVVLTPANRRRGAAVVLATVLLVVGATSTAPSSVRDAVVLGSIGVLALGLLTGGRRPIRGGAVIVLVLTFLVLAQIVTVIAFPVATLQFARLAALGAFALLVVTGLNEDERRIVLRALVAVALAEVVLGVVEVAVTHRPIPWGDRVASDGSVSALRNTLLPGSLLRVAGSLGHPIAYSMLLGVALVVVVVTAGARPRWRTIAFAALLVLGILLSGSRTTIVGLAIAAGFLVWTADRSGRIVRVLVVVIGSVIAGIVFAPDLAAAIDRLVGSGSYTNRAGAFEAIGPLLGRSPLEALFGSGFGTDRELYDRGFFPQNGFWVIDNQLVTTLGTEGLVGVLLVIAALVVAFLRADRTGRALLLVLATMLFSFDYFGWPAMFFLFVLSLALPKTPPADHRVGTVNRRGLTHV